MNAPLTNSFSQSMAKHFQNLMPSFLKAISVLFDLSNWPDNRTELATFGTSEHFHLILMPCGDFESMGVAR